MIYPDRELTNTSKVQECCGQEFAAKLGEFDYSELQDLLGHYHSGNGNGVHIIVGDIHR